MNRRTLWIILAVAAGIVLAVWAYRRGFRLRPAAAPAADEVPVTARPRYLTYGGFYDPAGSWPYGDGSSYSAYVLPSNSGTPTTQVLNPGGRSPATGPLNPLTGGNFTGGGQGRGR